MLIRLSHRLKSVVRKNCSLKLDGIHLTGTSNTYIPFPATELSLIFPFIIFSLFKHSSGSNYYMARAMRKTDAYLHSHYRFPKIIENCTGQIHSRRFNFLAPAFERIRASNMIKNRFARNPFRVFHMFRVPVRPGVAFHSHL